MKSIKPPTTYNQQLKKLQEHNCSIDDPDFARRVLKRINYYRFSAYLIPFKSNTDPEKYRDGTNFRQVYQIYEFDRKLRSLIFSTIEEIELSLRAHISYYFSHKYGALGYLDVSNLSKRHNQQNFEDKLKKYIYKNRKQPFVAHHIQEYNSQFPLWVIVELFTLGDLSMFYSDMHVADKKDFTDSFCKFHHASFESWLLCITHLRNYCAHYARLYYNLFPALPKTPKEYDVTLGRDLFSYLIVLNFLQRNRRSWHNSFFLPLKALIEEYKEDISLAAMGFPNDWDQRLTAEYMIIK